MKYTKMWEKHVENEVIVLFKFSIRYSLNKFNIVCGIVSFP